MAPDFKSIVSEAKRRHEETSLAEGQKQNLERERDNRQGNLALKWLQGVVIPLITQAKTALQQEGIPVEVDQEFEVVNRINPRPWLSIRCSGPKTERLGGGHSNPQSTAFFIDCDGDSFRAGYNTLNMRQPEKWSSPRPIAMPNVDEFISDGIKTVVDSYYAEVRKGR
jgi:hypothetical protein